MIERLGPGEPEEIIPGVFALFTASGIDADVLNGPETVAAFDQLVDEFNKDLPRIIENRDNHTVQVFFSVGIIYSFIS